MAKFARIEGNVVAELFQAENIDELRTRFHPDLIREVKECSGEVEAGWVFGSGKFAPPAGPVLTDIKSARISALRDDCEQAITAGFVSPALGVTHTYPSDIKAQINLMGSVTDSLMPDQPADWSTPFWVCDTKGDWKWEAHTAAQIQQAGRDGKAHVVKCQALLSDLTTQVLSAKTTEDVDAVLWPDETA